jgi:hypothetical protein
MKTSTAFPRERCEWRKKEAETYEVESLGVETEWTIT